VPGTVLVVDDDLTLLKLVNITLQGVGFHVLLAPDATQAVQLLSTASLGIGVAVIDYELPGSRLTDLIETVRSQGNQVRLIVTSGYPADMLEGFGDSLPAGVDFLKKPFLPREIVVAVQRAFAMTSGSTR
jgi:DNA-binding response OmpR family regulator